MVIVKDVAMVGNCSVPYLDYWRMFHGPLRVLTNKVIILERKGGDTSWPIRGV